MGYSDQKYYARPLVKVASAIAFGTSTGAGTASNSLAQPAASQLPEFINRTKITMVEAIAVTAIAANANPVNLTILNGTNIVAQIPVGTFTAGQVGTATVTSANAVFTAGTQPTMALIGTFTASGGTSGTWDLYFEQQELPVNPGSGS